jgi:uncharacterized Zn finger protein (UPF0148 family)
MSTDDGDDEGFDKEAEREKLREKYGKDQQDRESTQRMSELLLQGATMTGKHCNDCGDPIFRYDGQEFCPTCQHEGRQAQAGGEGGAGTDAGADHGDADVRSTEGAETAGRSDDAGSGEDGDEPRVEINDVRVADRSELRSPPSQRDQADGPRAADRGRAGHAHSHDASDRSAGERPRDAASARSASPGSIDDARASLVRTLNDLARRAEAADDVARTRDLLGASREAAEALAALDRTNR